MNININDIMVIAGFVLCVMLLCKLWGCLVLRDYEKNEIITRINKKIFENFSVDTLELAGVCDDGNSDFEFIKAVKKIELLDDIRIKL